MGAICRELGLCTNATFSWIRFMAPSCTLNVLQPKPASRRCARHPRIRHNASMTSIWPCPTALLLSALTAHAQQPATVQPDDWMNCFAIVAGKDCTVDGSVIVAHNEDSGTNSAVHHWKVAAEKHEPGKMRALLEGGSVPYAGETHGYIWSQMPGLKYSDTYFNECGVAVVTNACKSRETQPDLTDGGITLLLRRIVGARASSARHGVKIATELLGQFGYGDSGRCMTIADGREAWILNMVHGKHWAAARVPDDMCAVIANHFSIHRIDASDTDNFMLSPGLIDYAEKRGWYDGERDGAFDFATVFGGDGARKHASNIRRAWRANNLLGAKKIQEAWLQPTFIKPKRKVSTQDLMGILRDHYEGTDYDKSLGYSLSSPNANGATICAGGTSFSTVFQLRSDKPTAIAAVMWIAMGRPDASIYVPWYAGMTAIPVGYSSGDRRDAERLHMDSKFMALGSPPRFAAVNDYERQLDLVYGDQFDSMDKSRDAIEARWFAAQEQIEAGALALHAKAPAEACRLLTTYASERQTEASELMAKWAASLAVTTKHSAPDRR
ncbi:MAG: dipeptidase [Planctomycetota bacterium]